VSAAYNALLGAYEENCELGCGCQLRRPFASDPDEGNYDDISLTFCPLHAAAEDLRAACEAHVKELEEQCLALGWSSVEEYRKHHADSESYPLALAALAKAKAVTP
jgi:hypothetical protein